MLEALFLHVSHASRDVYTQLQQCWVSACQQPASAATMRTRLGVPVLVLLQIGLEIALVHVLTDNPHCVDLLLILRISLDDRAVEMHNVGVVQQAAAA